MWEILLGLIIGYAMLGSVVSNLVSQAMSGIQGSLGGAAVAEEEY